MYLYSLTLNQATAINNSVYGNFSGHKHHELVVAKGKILEMMRLNEESMKLQVVYRQEVFGQIRKIISFRLLGMQKDFLVVGSDSGRIVILEFDPEHNKFVKIHQETFGKTGVRRIVPGEYLAADPKGRAIMIGAAEKQKFVYILNRDSQNKLTISSPLEAHKPHTITFDMIGVDVGIENPQFACLEVDYGESDNEQAAVVTGDFQKTLTFYEMDLGLNHVVRKYSTPVDNKAHMLIQVPSDPLGPSGVIVVSEDFICYKKVEHEDRECAVPRRNDQLSDKSLFFTCYTLMKIKEQFYFLLQSELGDLYKISLQFTKSQVHGITIQYFDTIQPCNAINFLKTGYLFAAAEYTNHLLFNFQDLGDNDPNPIITNSTQSKSDLVTFNPRELLNIAIVDEFQNLASINDLKVEDLTGEGNPQLYAACGRGAYSTLRILRHGLTVLEIAQTPMPIKPVGVTTLKGKLGDQYDKFMIVSFQTSTIVLSIGQEQVSEVKNSGFYGNERTIHAGILDDDSYIQVTPTSITHIKGDPENRKRSKWESGKGKILKACSNSRQVVISIEGSQLIYFELDSMTGNLSEVDSRIFDSEINCIDLGEVPEGRERCGFLAIGYEDKTVKIHSLNPESYLQRISTLALPDTPESVAIVNFKRDDQQQQQMFLHVGMVNGVLLRTVVDNVTGALSDSRTKFLGTQSIQLIKIKQQNSDAIVALCNKPWLCYTYMNKVSITPLSYDMLESASSFSSDKCPEGIVAINGNTLRIIQVEKLGETFTQKVVPLRYTPTKIKIHPETNFLVILEKDHNCYSSSERKKIKEDIVRKTGDKEFLKMKDELIGYPKARANSFASCIRILDPFSLSTIELIEFEGNEVVFSHFISSTLGHPGETFLFLGVGMDVKLAPRSCSLGFIKCYKFVDNGSKLQFCHSTPCEDIPGAFNEYKGRLIVGVGNVLRIYELGAKKLLRKVENKNFQSPIINIQVDEGRIFAGDIQESVHVLKYHPESIMLYIFADDVINRWLTSFCLLDQDTMAGVDKFENVFINRLPVGCEDDAEDDPTATKFKWENGYLNGAAFKMEEVAAFYTGEVGTCIQKASLSQGSQEVIIFGTTMGSIGALLPFELKEDIDFFVHLEMYLRIESQPLCGRDHVTFRSSFIPTKNVVDGDLCEMFSSLEFNKQSVLSQEMDRTPPEVLKKLENLRNKML